MGQGCVCVIENSVVNAGVLKKKIADGIKGIFIVIS